MSTISSPIFWRDARMPYVELRKISDARQVCYAPHSHTYWSLGAITAGNSTFCYRDAAHQISAGDIVMMNPHWVHACNPIENQPWAYIMLYVDTEWLSGLRYQLGLLNTPDWQDIATAVITQPALYAGYCDMAACLLDEHRDISDKQTALVEYLSTILQVLAQESPEALPQAPSALEQVAAYLRANCSADISLERLCKQSGYSAGHLIRAFKQHFGLTPHAYLINQRIQMGQKALKQGQPIVEAALNAGFNDQPHFQRTFKRLVAATPNQYRYPLLNQ
ncbi:AraC family transcriptional regulator [Halomonas alkaliantarctica]|uniref:AraC family transcriptional regulator n=1 Tax=Halomonas alkaliantarctica TaxID=232346 RepID=A0ABY8LHG5_9GAMM|nr:AraC family transcriptional regulator [Halomonas alkaliantarctica]WGI23908.1 AraC family transcriptional regulator [Halomonas alkaliantarctica]